MKGMLDGINPDGTSGWGEIAGVMLGSALVLLIIAVGVGLAMAIWGRNRLSAATAQKGWVITALAGIGAMVLGSVGAGINWGTSQGTGSLMPEGARPQAVTVEKQAPKHTCTRQAVRDFEKEDSPPDRAERERLVRKLAGDDVEISIGHEIYRFDKGPGEPGVRGPVIAVVKWTAADGPDCSADNETVAECTDVEVRVDQKGRGPGQTHKFRVGQDCENA